MMRCTPKLICGSSARILTLIRESAFRYKLFLSLSSYLFSCGLKKDVVLILAVFMSVFVQAGVFLNRQL